MPMHAMNTYFPRGSLVLSNLPLTSDFLSSIFTGWVVMFIYISQLVRFARCCNSVSDFVFSGSKIVKRLWRWKYDALIIERTIFLVFGPSKALYRSFLKHCTLTNKAVGTVWRDLSKPPQRRQGPDSRPIWLLDGISLVLGHELASRRAEHSLLWRMSLYIFDILCLSPYMFV